MEFWAWNVIADTDLTINHRLELYGTTIFRIEGGYNRNDDLCASNEP
ncbi:MAG: hypothetical protein LBF08_02515 [Dysgonamonadaceae bacterium]|nr:hypothetical protein [Dysgonamonadaceae bacterium]